ncbi:MAG: hypothetical protein KatS3mg121_0496 [Gammaproteobacteria bacterium]|nr:MAG: hypothetical protein KatS3mg121_0496 [Gammaproteobacteria bacterium]
MTTLHIAIVTGQPLANFIPILQERPQQVLLLQRPSMRRQAEQFQRALHEIGYHTGQIDIDETLPETGFEDLGEYALDLQQRINERYPDAEITWNATGGTKLMALALWDLFDARRVRVIYLDTQHGLMEQLRPKPGVIPLESVLTPELYLTAMGKIFRSALTRNTTWIEMALYRSRITFKLAKNAGSLLRLFQQWQRTWDKSDRCPATLSVDSKNALHNQIMKALSESGVVVITDESTYQPPNASSIEYLTGGWLEEYVYLAAKDAGIEHVEVGLKFGDRAQRKKGQDNEIDGFLIHNNRLLLVECKTGNLLRDGRDTDIVYKLDSIGQNAGGVQATRLLLSAQPLEHITGTQRRVDTRARARATRIETLAGGEIARFKQALIHWRDTGQWSASP